MIEHTVAEHHVPERLADRLPRHMRWRRMVKGAQVGAVLDEGHRQPADILVVLAELHGAGVSRLGQPVRVRLGRQRTAGNLQVPVALEVLNAGLEHRERDAEPGGELHAGLGPAEVQSLGDEAVHHLNWQPGLLQRPRSGGHGSGRHRDSHRFSPADSCLSRAIGGAKDGSAVRERPNASRARAGLRAISHSTPWL